MPDLSNLLGAVYGDSPSSTPRDPEDEAHVEHEPAATERGPSVPDWADDEHLDAAFAQWKPGPPEDASPAEHAFVADGDNDEPPPPLADDLAAALSEALVASSGTADDTDDYGFKPNKVVDFSDPEGEQAHDLNLRAPTPFHTEEPLPPEKAENVKEPLALAPPIEDTVDTAAPVEEHVAERHEEPAPTDDEDHLRHVPTITPQRAAAAELTAASWVQPESVVAEPSPQPEPTATASAPIPTVPPVVTPTPAAEASPADATTPMAAVAVDERRWERADDDILPDKQTKKFFSLSLRRG